MPASSVRLDRMRIGTVVAVLAPGLEQPLARHVGQAQVEHDQIRRLSLAIRSSAVLPFEASTTA